MTAKMNEPTTFKTKSTMKTMLESKEFLMFPNAIQQVKLWIVQILMDLEHMHNEGFAHLDVKLENVRITADMKAVLWGLEYLSTTKFPASECGMKKSFAPPEMNIKNPGLVLMDGVSADMWSVGILVLNAFTGSVLAAKVEKKPTYSWSKGIYPALFEILKEKKLNKYVRRAFPASIINKRFIKSLKNNLMYLLQLNPNYRPSPGSAVLHEFLGQGFYKIDKETLWTSKEKSWRLDTYTTNYRKKLRDSYSSDVVYEADYFNYLKRSIFRQKYLTDVIRKMDNRTRDENQYETVEFSQKTEARMRSLYQRLPQDGVKRIFQYIEKQIAKNNGSHEKEDDDEEAYSERLQAGDQNMF